MAVPFSFEILEAAKAWSIPPWSLTGEPDDEATRSRYFFLQRIYHAMGI